MSAIDFANYTPVPTAKQLDALKAAGVTRAVVGASYGDVAHKQAAAFSFAGIDVEAYAWLTPQPWYGATVRDAFTHLGDVAVARWWLDCEEAMGVLMPAAVRIRIADALRVVAQLAPNARRGIYTTAAWWSRWTGDWEIVKEFPDMDLWEAHYVHADGDDCAGVDNERAAIPAFVPFGGWTSRVMVQWHPTTTLVADIDGGLSVDLDEIEEDPMDAPTKGEFQGLYGLVDARWKATLVIADALFGLVRHVYGDDDPKIADIKRRLDELKTDDVARGVPP